MIRRIFILLFFFLMPAFLVAQEFYSSLNNYSRILINPSYAGYNYESNVWSSYSVFAKSKDEVFNEFTLIYDRFAPKLKGGTAFYLKQGLQGNVNTNTIELGISYTPRIKKFQGAFLPSVYLGYNKPVKQWFVYGFDEWRSNFENYEFIPGKVYFRPDLYKIGGSLLFIIDNIQFGISGNYGFQATKDNDLISSCKPYKIIAHLSTRASRKSRGILSRSKVISPQFIVHFENGLLQGKSEIRVNGRRFLYSAFMLNNISDNIHNLGGSAGFENDVFRLIFSGGFGTTTKLDRLTFNSSLSLLIKLPKENIQRTFPFKPLWD